MANFIDINSENPQERKLLEVVEVLRKGGLVIYPTDTIYGVGCDLYNKKAVQNLCRLKEIKANKMNLSFICYDLSDLSQYAKNVGNYTFKAMKKALPGPYTFILEASNKVPKILDVKKKQVGIRIPDNNIPRELVRLLGNPIITTSIKEGDDSFEYITDPELINEKYGKLVDVIIDGGFGGNVASTVINCIDDEIELIREGQGNFGLLL